MLGLYVRMYICLSGLYVRKYICFECTYAWLVCSNVDMLQRIDGTYMRVDHVKMYKRRWMHTATLTIIEGRETASNGFLYQFTTGKPFENLKPTLNYEENSITDDHVKLYKNRWMWMHTHARLFFLPNQRFCMRACLGSL